MEPQEIKKEDEHAKLVISRLLRTGVFTAAITTVIGGLLYIINSKGPIPSYHIFKGVPEEYKTLLGIWHGLLSLQSWAIIQTGVILLILTPIARVLFSLAVFIKEKDRLYIIITIIVLGIIAFSTIGDLA